MIKRSKIQDRRLCSIATHTGDISYSLIRSGRRRTIEISISEAMEVRVVAPRFVQDKAIHAFIQEKARWIRKKLEETKVVNEILQSRKYKSGHKFLFLGKKYELEVNAGDIRQTRISFDGIKWKIKTPFMDSEQEAEQLVKDKLIKWYRVQAKEILGGRVFHYVRIMGLEPKKIVVKTQKRIWGSCCYHGKTINLNWYLVLAPLAVIDYVIVHELCHLAVPSHSKKFWNKVGKFLPDYKTRQKWLKDHRLDLVLP